MAEIADDYVRGLIEGEGCFTFQRGTRIGTRMIGRSGSINLYEDMWQKIPTFSLAMTIRDVDLIRKIREKMGLKNRVYVYPPRKRKDGYKRQGMAVLMVRDPDQLKNKIIPFFHKKLVGYKAKQFEDWMEKLETDLCVPASYKSVYRTLKSGVS